MQINRNQKKTKMQKKFDSKLKIAKEMKNEGCRKAFRQIEVQEIKMKGIKNLFIKVIDLQMTKSLNLKQMNRKVTDHLNIIRDPEKKF